MGGPNIAMLNAAVALLIRTSYCQRFIRDELYFVKKNFIKKAQKSPRELSKRMYIKLS